RVRNGTSGGPYSLWKRLDDPSTQMIVCLMAKFRQASGDIIYDAAAGNAANSGWIRVMACEVNSHARGRYYHGRTCGRDTLRKMPNCFTLPSQNVAGITHRDFHNLRQSSSSQIARMAIHFVDLCCSSAPFEIYCTLYLPSTLINV